MWHIRTGQLGLTRALWGLAQVIELFKAADKYDVLGLVQECVASFRQLTGAEEVAPLLKVAAERHSEELHAVCVDVAGQCLPDVLVTILTCYCCLDKFQPASGCACGAPWEAHVLARRNRRRSHCQVTCLLKQLQLFVGAEAGRCARFAASLMQLF
jgi:hypothetical protein